MKPPAAGHLTLIGTVHRKRGAAPLQRLLADLRPYLLTMEMSPYALAFRQRRDAIAGGFDCPLEIGHVGA